MLPTKESLNADVESLQKLINEKPNTVTEFPGYLKKITALKDRVQSSQQALTAAGKEFRSDMDTLRQALSPEQVQRLKVQDLKTVMEKLDIKIPSSEDLVCVLMGKDISEKLATAISWYRKLNDYIPAGGGGKTGVKPRQVPRMNGVDVAFPVTRGYPDFLLEKAEFSGMPAVTAAPEGLTFSKLSGSLKGLTTQPALYGKAATFNITGALTGGGAWALSFKGTVDHRTAPAADAFTLTVKGIELRQRGSDTARQLPLQLISGDITVDSNLRIQGETLEGRTLLMVLNPEIAVSPKAAAFKDLFKNTGPFNVIISVGGTLEQPSMALRSSLTNTLESGLNNIVKSKLGGLENRLKTYISSRIDADVNKADSETDGLEKSITGNISERLDLAGRILKEASGQEASPAKFLDKKGFPLPF